MDFLEYRFMRHLQNQQRKEYEFRNRSIKNHINDLTEVEFLLDYRFEKDRVRELAEILNEKLK